MYIVLILSNAMQCASDIYVCGLLECNVEFKEDAYTIYLIMHCQWLYLYIYNEFNERKLVQLA